MIFQKRCRTIVLLGISLILPIYGDPVTKVKGFDPRSVTFNVPDLVAHAKKGDGAAYYQLGIMFLCGHQVQKNHFIAYDYLSDDKKDGVIRPLGIIEEHCTTVYKVQEAFSALDLPEGNVYRDAIRRSLYGEE